MYASIMDKYSPEVLKQRSFILSSFTRMKMTLTTSIYEFANNCIERNWCPVLDKLEKVDEEILQEYNRFMNNDTRRN